MKRKSRQVPRLQSTLHSRLGIYSAGAVTGALSIVSSDAAIVYVNSGVLLTDNLTTDGSYTAWSIDFNGDAVSDMRIWTKDATGSAAPLANNAFITAPAQAGGNVGVLGVTNANNFHYPSRLAAGATKKARGGADRTDRPGSSALCRTRRGSARVRAR